MKVCRRPMGYEAVPLHLPELDPTEPFPICHRLSGQGMNRSRVPELHLIFCHVDQTLVERGANKDERLHRLPRSTIIDPLVSPSRETNPAKILAQINNILPFGSNFL